MGIAAMSFLGVLLGYYRFLEARIITTSIIQKMLGITRAFSHTGIVSVRPISIIGGIFRKKKNRVRLVYLSCNINDFRL